MAQSNAQPSLARELIVSIGFYGLPLALRGLLSFAVTPIYTRMLTPSDYGMLELLDLTLFLFSAAIGMNFAHGFFYYYAQSPDEPAKRVTLSTAWYGSLALGVLPALAALCFATPISRFLFGSADSAYRVQIVLATLAVTFPLEVALASLRPRNLARQYSILQLTRYILTPALVIVLMTVFHLGLDSLLWGSLAMALAYNVVMMGMLGKTLLIPPCASQFGRMLTYSMPLNISGLLMVLLDSGDRYFLRGNVSLADIGIYGLAYKAGMIVMSASLMFNYYWKSRMYDIAKRPGGDAIFARVGTYYFTLITLSAVGVSTLLPALLPILVGKDFRVAAPYIPWIAAICILKVVSDFLRNALYLTRKTAQDTLITIVGTTVCVSGYLALIPTWGLWGAIAATLLGFSVLLILSYLRGQRARHFDYEFGRLSRIGAVTVALLTLAPLAQSGTITWRLLNASLLVLAYPALLWLLRVPRHDEIDWVKQNVLAVARLLRQRPVA